MSNKILILCSSLTSMFPENSVHLQNLLDIFKWINWHNVSMTKLKANQKFPIPLPTCLHTPLKNILCKYIIQCCFLNSFQLELRNIRNTPISCYFPFFIPVMCTDCKQIYFKNEEGNYFSYRVQICLGCFIPY